MVSIRGVNGRPSEEQQKEKQTGGGLRLLVIRKTDWWGAEAGFSQ